MKQNSFKRLSSIAFVSVGAGIFLGFPALAGGLNATSKDLLAQTTPSGSTPTLGSPSDSPGTPSKPASSTPSDSSGTPSKPAPSKPSDSSGSSSSPASTPAKDSQSVKDPNVQPGGWTCLNNPNPQCR